MPKLRASTAHNADDPFMRPGKGRAAHDRRSAGWLLCLRWCLVWTRNWRVWATRTRRWSGTGACWRRLQRYFAARGAEEFSLDLAMAWVDEACGFFAKEQAGTLKQTDVYLHVTGSPGLGLLRRLRPARPFGGQRAYPRHPGRMPAAGEPDRMVPVFTAIRSAEEEPGCVPAASPWVRRRPSPWPPGAAQAHRPGSSRRFGRRQDAPRPAQIRQVRAGVAIEGRKTPVPRAWVPQLM